MTQPIPQHCDGCEKQFLRAELRSYKNLDLCAKCFKAEEEAVAALQNTAPMPAARLPISTAKFTPLAIQQALTKRLQDFISMNHQDFFNQEIEEVRDLTIEQLRDRIEEMAEAYFGAEAEAIRKKTKFQAASQIFNDKSKKLTETEREALKATDDKYVIPKLADPTKAKARNIGETKAKAKKSLETGLENLFGDRADEIMKKLLGS